MTKRRKQLFHFQLQDIPPTFFWQVEAQKHLLGNPLRGITSLEIRPANAYSTSSLSMSERI